MVLEWIWFTILTIAGSVLFFSFIESIDPLGNEVLTLPLAVVAYGLAALLLWSMSAQAVGDWLAEFVPRPGSLIHGVTVSALLCLAFSTTIVGLAILQISGLKKLRHASRPAV